MTAELNLMRSATELPIEPGLAWMRRGLCVASPTPDMWFPEMGQSAVAADAKSVCAGCPVRDDCLAYAVAMGIRHGIWGGTVPEEREERKTRRRQSHMDLATRSRKTEAERKRRRRLREAAGTGDPEAAEHLERERARKRTTETLAAARQRARKARAAT